PGGPRRGGRGVKRVELVQLGVGPEEVQRFYDQVRRELYAPLSGRRAGEEDLLDRLRGASRMIETEWVRIGEGSDLVGKSLQEAGIRSRTGASVVAIIRGEEAIPSPDPSTVLEAGDVVGVLGTPGQREAFRDLAAASRGAAAKET
ncbi:MAG: portal protein, partial [Rubrobacter sp.]|nr:portal protein [Rubrobacter sp.]